jgi:hypothetical protein
MDISFSRARERALPAAARHAPCAPTTPAMAVEAGRNRNHAHG